MTAVRHLAALGLASFVALPAHAGEPAAAGRGFVAQTRCDGDAKARLADGEFLCSDKWNMAIAAREPGQSVSLSSGMSRTEVATALEAARLTYSVLGESGAMQVSAFELRFRDGHLWAVAVLDKAS